MHLLLCGPEESETGVGRRPFVSNELKGLDVVDSGDVKEVSEVGETGVERDVGDLREEKRESVSGEERKGKERRGRTAIRRFEGV